MGCQRIIEWWGVTVAEVGGCLLKSRTLVKGCSRVLVSGDTEMLRFRGGTGSNQHPRLGRRVCVSLLPH